MQLGIADMKKAPGKSLTYGVMATIVCYIAAYAGFVISGPLVLLTILSCLTLIGPVMAIGLYSISCQLQNGRVPKLSYCVRDGTRGLGNLGLFTSVLVVLFLLWIHVGHLLHLFFPAGGFMSDKVDLIFFFGIGSDCKSFDSLGMGGVAVNGDQYSVGSYVSGGYFERKRHLRSKGF